MFKYFRRRRAERLKASYFKYFDELPEPARSRAKENYGSLEVTSKAHSIFNALMHGFNWEHSPEGRKYWRDLYYGTLDANKTGDGNG